VDSEVMTAPSAPKVYVSRKETNGRSTAVTSLRCSTGPVPGMSRVTGAVSAAHVEDPVRSEFLRDGEVGGQVVARAVEGVVDRSQARVGENRVGHTATVSAQPRHQLEADLVHRSLARTCTGYVEYEMWRSRE
jgi:hypothetical protein